MDYWTEDPGPARPLRSYYSGPSARPADRFAIAKGSVPRCLAAAFVRFAFQQGSLAADLI
jgi:hypothetical protein